MFVNDCHVAHWSNKQDGDLCFLAILQLTIEELSKKDTKFAADISAMYEAMIAGKYEFETDTARSLNSDIPSFESWVESNKEAIEKAWE